MLEAIRAWPCAGSSLTDAFDPRSWTGPCTANRPQFVLPSSRCSRRGVTRLRDHPDDLAALVGVEVASVAEYLLRPCLLRSRVVDVSSRRSFAPLICDAMGGVSCGEDRQVLL